MAKKKIFDDPLHGIDPVLKDAFGGDGVSVSREPKADPKTDFLERLLRQRLPDQPWGDRLRCAPSHSFQFALTHGKLIL